MIAKTRWQVGFESPDREVGWVPYSDLYDSEEQAKQQRMRIYQRTRTAAPLSIREIKEDPVKTAA
jgi:hypothetical protein